MSQTPDAMSRMHCRLVQDQQSCDHTDVLTRSVRAQYEDSLDSALTLVKICGSDLGSVPSDMLTLMLTRPSAAQALIRHALQDQKVEVVAGEGEVEVVLAEQESAAAVIEILDGVLAALDPLRRAWPSSGAPRLEIAVTDAGESISFAQGPWSLYGVRVDDLSTAQMINRSMTGQKVAGQAYRRVNRDRQEGLLR